MVGDRDAGSSWFGVDDPGDFGSGNSTSSSRGVSTFGARRRTATARGAANSGGSSSGGDASLSVAFFFLGALLRVEAHQ